MKNGGINKRLPTLPNLPTAGGGGAAPQPNPIYGTAPTLGEMFDGDKLSDVVTWGTQGPEGVSVGYEMSLDGGTWVLYDGDTEGETGDMWQVRKIVVLDDFSRTYTSATQTVQPAPIPVPVNSVAPAITGDLIDGETLSLSTGTWTPTPDEIERQWLADATPVGSSSTLDLTGREGEVISARTRARMTGGDWSDWETATGGGEVQPVPSEIEIPDAILVSGRSTEMVAPEGITFRPDLDLIGAVFEMDEPTGVYDARMHDLTYIWTFDDEYTYVAPVNTLAAFKAAGEAIGFNAAHVFRQPGTYTVRLDVYGVVGGNIVHAYSEEVITIGDPETIFAGTRTCFVSPSSDWTHCPLGAVQRTNINSATEYAMEGPLPYRIMLNRGETYSFSGRRFGFNVPGGDTCTLHMVAGPGEGAAPILTCTGGISCGANNDSQYVDKTLVVQGLVLNGPYDPTAPGDPDTTDAFSFWGPYSPQQILIDQCEARGFGHGAYIGETEPRHVYFNDSVIEGYGKWGVMGGGYDGLAILGSRIMSHVDAPIDNGASMGGTLRVSNMDTTIIASTDFFCRQGWSGLGGSYIAAQPCIRTESHGDAGHQIVLTRNSFEGGFSMISLSRGDDASVAHNALVDSCYFLGGYQTGAMVETSNGGITVRNNVVVLPNTTTRLGPGMSNFANYSRNGSNAEAQAAPMRTYGNTFVNMVGTAAGIVDNSGGYSTVSTENNVVHQPNASPAQTGDAPLVTTPALWTPREKGYKSTTVPLMTDTATPAGAPATYAPDTGSAAIGDADSGLVPTLYYSGEARGEAPNRGAWGSVLI